jgi:hypothetical protein
MKITNAKLVDALAEIEALKEPDDIDDLSPHRWCFSCERISLCRFHEQCQRMSCECTCAEKFVPDVEEEEA